MTEVLHSPSSSSSPSISTPTRNATLFQQTQLYVGEEAISRLIEEEEEINRVREKREKDRRDQLSLLTILISLFRKSFLLRCKTDRENFSGGSGVMEIGFPTDVQHVNHVTFDRFDGFLGLPVEFEPEVLRRAPSASATVFGVSTESMQLSYDHRGNSIPTILLLMQSHLYSRGGLQAEGIFRITAGNSQEEYVRDELNRGVVSEGIDVHCLGGLIKAWFRELPRGILDSLSPEQVMQCESEEDCDALVRLLPPTEACLLNWSINLMADVVQQEHLNKMNAHNVAMVFAPNMTQMSDPLTALMYAVQVMNFLKTLIEKTLREREDSIIESSPIIPHLDPSDGNEHHSSSLQHTENPTESNEPTIHAFVVQDPVSDSCSETNQANDVTDEEYPSYSTTSAESVCFTTLTQVYRLSCSQEAKETKGIHNKFEECNSNESKFEMNTHGLEIAFLPGKNDNNKSKGISNLCRVNSMTERIEAWR